MPIQALLTNVFPVFEQYVLDITHTLSLSGHFEFSKLIKILTHTGVRQFCTTFGVFPFVLFSQKNLTDGKKTGLCYER